MAKGNPSSTVYYSRQRVEAMKKRKKKTEERWANRSGEVVSYKAGDPKVEAPLPSNRSTPPKTMKDREPKY